jgi:hypothetical protein
VTTYRTAAVAIVLIVLFACFVWLSFFVEPTPSRVIDPDHPPGLFDRG